MDSQPVIDLTEDEEKALNDLIDKIDLPDIGKEYFFKSLLWADLRLQRPNHKDDDFSTKSIYLLVDKYGDPDRCSWYSIPLGKEPDPSCSSILSPIEEMGTSHPTSAVAFPPKRIVTLGGYRYSTAKYFDIEDPKGGWKELPNLSASRDMPSAIAADGKIYVAGFPRIFSPTKPFVDVFDPNWNETSWYKIENDEMPDLDSPIPGGTFISLGRRRHILFHGSAFRKAASVLYTFDLVSGEFNLAECPFPLLDEGAAVVVDGYICAFVKNNLDMRAYDLTTKKWIPNPVSGLDDINWNCANLRLLPIGRKRMCIITDDSIIRDGQEADKEYLKDFEMSVRCRLTIFDVEKKDDGGLKANIISSTIFIVPGGSIIHACIVI